MTGANPYAVGARTALDRLAEALRSVVQDLDPATIALGVVAIAGWDPSDAVLARGLSRAWRAAGLTCPCLVVSDLEAAFASVSPTGHGVVLVAGTGAAAARIQDWRTVQVADGCGWLVGDEGSGFWLGQQAVGRVLASLDGRGPRTLLADGVTRSLGLAPGVSRSRAETARDIIRVVYGQPPVALATLAPLVTEAADAGDRVARRIIRQAASALVTTLRAVVPRDDPPAVVVLGGSVLSAPNPLATLVQRDLRRAGMESILAADGVDGALALALRSLDVEPGSGVPPGRPVS